MKKSSLKTLKLNKTAISSLEYVKGGISPCTDTCETYCECKSEKPCQFMNQA
ncbi:hypothetical protein IMCC3317_42570 [Kordia antarctica]|uniref:Uncharacterized protein n=1 Tax=Kordia antarctica TaxID=1218801 RepID=A0A7L4ZQU5_9FLAO|nr:hypothetical protein [Kordia antarctica]QHI38857.1 hypothetical protein IMCC3317_42570 [Kordia antarctica]